MDTKHFVDFEPTPKTK